MTVLWSCCTNSKVIFQPIARTACTVTSQHNHTVPHPHQHGLAAMGRQSTPKCDSVSLCAGTGGWVRRWEHPRPLQGHPPQAVCWLRGCGLARPLKCHNRHYHKHTSHKCTNSHTNQPWPYRYPPYQQQQSPQLPQPMRPLPLAPPPLTTSQSTRLEGLRLLLGRRPSPPPPSRSSSTVRVPNQAQT